MVRHLIYGQSKNLLVLMFFTIYIVRVVRHIREHNSPLCRKPSAGSLVRVTLKVVKEMSRFVKYLLRSKLSGHKLDKCGPNLYDGDKTEMQHCLYLYRQPK